MQDNLLIPDEILAGGVGSLPYDFCPLNVGDVDTPMVLEEGENTAMASAFCFPGSLPLAKKPISPNIRFSMLWKSNRVN